MQWTIKGITATKKATLFAFRNASTLGVAPGGCGWKCLAGGQEVAI